MGFLGGSTVKNSPAIAGDAGDLDSILRSGRSPEEGNSDPLHYSCLENAMDSRASWLPSTGSQTAGHTETGHACNTGPQHHVQKPWRHAGFRIFQVWERQYMHIFHIM